MGSANKPAGTPLPRRSQNSALTLHRPSLDLTERKGTGQTVRLLMFALGNELAIDRRSKSEVNYQGRAVRWVYGSSLLSLTPPFYGGDRGWEFDVPRSRRVALAWDHSG